MTISGIIWIINLIYAFKYWGFGYGILNIFIPFALIWDLFTKYLLHLVR